MGTPRTSRGGGSKRNAAFRTTLVVLAGLALFLGQVIPASADDPLTDALRRKQELERAVAVSRANTARYKVAADQFQAAVNNSNAVIGDLQARADAAQSQAEQLGYEIQIAEEQLQIVSFQLDETNALVSSLKAQVDAENKQLSQREDLYAKHLRTTYRQAQVSPLEMLLSSSSISDFASRIQAMVIINRQDVQLANEIRTMRDETAANVGLTEDKVAEIVGLQDQITQQRAALATQKARYDQLIEEAQNAIDSQSGVRDQAAAARNAQLGAAVKQNQQTADLNKQLEQAEAQYEQLAALAAAKSGLGVYTGGKLPLWPLRGALTSPFGARWGGFHNGLDIAAPMYSPIVAAAAGRVTTVGKPYLAYGDTATVVIIAHGNNFSTLYGHLDDRVHPPVVQVGQFVSAGQLIAYEGMTGWTTGPHLHFMTILNGRAVDPRPYLP
ncbi:MAG TPA: peptidoglycan DD-metalloendopeptidase family protein [Candidatus Limnocylindria bacterium]|nr:peptidoglycan DD-metalloendopeptidase family protein [Candidatus Limnocylindria bacterium]